MNAERMREVYRLFQAVSDMPTERRAETLRDHCGADDDLYAEVLGLLREADDDRTANLHDAALKLEVVHLLICNEYWSNFDGLLHGLLTR